MADMKIRNPIDRALIRTISDPFQTRMLREMIKWQVQRAITCPIGGQVLDVRTCIAVIDPSDDVLTVVSPETFAKITADAWRALYGEHPGYGVTSAVALPARS